MIFRRHIELKKGQLDIAPLVDIVFLLLIFFMLTSNFITRQGIKVKLPGAASGKMLSGAETVIFIDANGFISVDGKRMDLDRLSDRIKVSARKNEHVFIKSDKDASMGIVVKVWDICRLKGIDSVSIATIPQE